MSGKEHTQCNRNYCPFRKNKTNKEKLFWSTWRVKWFFHFARNNPCHTKRFYHQFIIAMGGQTAWKLLPSEIRSAWNAAAGSFDKQYGLIKAWKNDPDIKERVGNNSYIDERKKLDIKNIEDLNKLAKCNDVLAQWVIELDRFDKNKADLNGFNKKADELSREAAELKQLAETVKALDQAVLAPEIDQTVLSNYTVEQLEALAKKMENAVKAAKEH